VTAPNPAPRYECRCGWIGDRPRRITPAPGDPPILRCPRCERAVCEATDHHDAGDEHP
jgi:predicted SprT family Zn-dependent metalloprotease